MRPGSRRTAVDATEAEDLVTGVFALVPGVRRRRGLELRLVPAQGSDEIVGTGGAALPFGSAGLIALGEDEWERIERPIPRRSDGAPAPSRSSTARRIQRAYQDPIRLRAMPLVQAVQSMPDRAGVAQHGHSAMRRPGIADCSADARKRSPDHEHSHRLKVAVVGGGVIGVSTAQQLARAGADVVLVTEGELTSGASGRSLSWLNSAGIRSEPYHRLRMAGIDRYRTLSAGTRVWTGCASTGGWPGRPRATSCTASTSTRWPTDTTVSCSPPTRSPSTSPASNPAAIPPAGALWRPGEGWVDLPSLVRFLAEDFVAARRATGHQRWTLPTRDGGRSGRRRTQRAGEPSSRSTPPCSPPVPPCRPWPTSSGWPSPRPARSACSSPPSRCSTS